MTIRIPFYEKIVQINKKLFDVWQKLGFHITPNHYYQPIPDTSTLEKKLWEKNTELIGIDMRDNFQLDLLNHFSDKFKPEYDAIPLNKTSIPYQYYLKNRRFNPADGKVYYSMIRHFLPKQILEVGAGSSTFLAAQAISKNKEESEYDCRLVAIEPYPSEILRKGFPNFKELLEKKIQDVPISFFEKLNQNDILFIDSSHILTIGSDVRYEILEILPRLRKGVIIHFHDIFLPAEYSKTMIFKNRLFFNEQYILQAFLAFNDAFEVLWAGSYMYLKYQNELTDKL
ncbi:MAG: class I SAM-dependent methyltransferase, partial [Promethearchaeota archaeon]